MKIPDDVIAIFESEIESYGGEVSLLVSRLDGKTQFKISRTRSIQSPTLTKGVGIPCNAKS